MKVTEIDPETNEQEEQGLKGQAKKEMASVTAFSEDQAHVKPTDLSFLKKTITTKELESIIVNPEDVKLIVKFFLFRCRNWNCRKWRQKNY